MEQRALLAVATLRMCVLVVKATEIFLVGQ